MKNIFVLMLLTCFSSIHAQTKDRYWKIHYTEEQGNVKLNAIAFAYKDHAFAVGDNGTILRIVRKNKATTVERVYTSFGPVSLEDIVFPDSIHGFIAGPTGYILYTNDSGLTWKNILLTGDFSKSSVLSLSCIDTKMIYAVTDDGELIQTTNGGEKWSMVHFGTGNEECKKVFMCKDGSVFIACEKDFNVFIYRKMMNEDSFHKIYEEKNSEFEDIKFKNGNNGIILTIENVVTVTSDESLHFIKYDLIHNKAGYFNTIAENSDGVLFLLGFGNSILKSTSDPQKWDNISIKKLSSWAGLSIQDANFDDDELGIAVGRDQSDSKSVGYLYATYNKGSNWERIYPYQDDNAVHSCLSSLHFISKDTVLALGYAYNKNKAQGVLFYSIDGGKLWGSSTKDQLSPLRSFSYAPNKIGIAVGDNGTIFRATKNIGDWNIVNFNSKVHLRKVKYLNGNIWFAVGDSSTIIKSTNAGITWQHLKLEENANLIGLSIVSKDKLFVCGMTSSDKKGVVYYSENGGLSWTKSLISQDTEDLFSEIYFIDEKTGFVATEKGKIMKTIDGGKTWFKTKCYEVGNINQIIFLDNNIGYAVGNHGLLKKTKDGGKSWELLYTLVDSDLQSIAISPDGKSILAVGNNGTILGY